MSRPIAMYLICLFSPLLAGAVTWFVLGTFYLGIVLAALGLVYLIFCEPDKLVDWLEGL